MWYLWQACCSIATFLLISYFAALFKNFRNARATGLPIVVSPVERLNFAWIVLQKPLKSVLGQLPFNLGAFAHYNSLGWWFDDKYRTHQKYGKVFINVTPGMNELHVADPAVVHQIHMRKWDFDRDEDHMKHSKFYGNSLVSTTGREWLRHRRITAPPFNERVMEILWTEAVRQTGLLTTYWNAKSRSKGGFSTTVDDLNTITLNVFIKAALGKSWDFCGGDEQQSKTDIRGRSDHDENRLSYRDSLFLITKNIITFVMMPTWLYSTPSWLLPAKLRTYVMAYNEFGAYLTQALSTAKEDYANGTVEEDPNFLKYLVLQSEEVRRKRSGLNKDDDPDIAGLSDSEIYGTMFTLNQTGHETITSLLSSTIFMLAAYPQWQEWMRKDSDALKQDSGNSTDPETPYQDIFPKLKRCIAIMNETLRLYPPIPMVYRSTIGSEGQVLVIDGRTVNIPPKTFVIPNIMAANTLPEFWGDDHMEWRPDRWINTDPISGIDTLCDPPNGKNTFFPFASGPRGCIGKRFAIVEFVAIISTLLRDYEVHVVPHGKESLEHARKRCRAAVVDGSEQSLVVHMTDPSAVPLRLVSRR